MSTHNFAWGEDEHGNEGWLLDNHPNFWAADARNLVHDCLEHLPRGEKHGPAADELLALGARLYLRVSSGWWFSQPFRIAPPEAWGGELRAVWDGCHDDPAPIKVVPLDDEDMECELQASLVEAVKQINEQLACGDAGTPFMTIESDWIDNAGAWLRAGFRAAIKRYKDHGADDVMWLASRMEDELARPRYKGQHGDRLVIKVHEKDLEFSVTHKELYA